MHGITGHNFETRHPSDDSDQVWFPLGQYFQRRRFLKKFTMYDARQVMAIAHMTLWVRWAKKKRLFVLLINFYNMRGGLIPTCYDVISLKYTQSCPDFSPKVRLMKRWNYVKIKLFYDCTIKTVHAHCQKISNSKIVFATKQSKNDRRALGPISRSWVDNKGNMKKAMY